MPEKLPLVDIHCHPTMKPFYSAQEPLEKKNIWEYIPESSACATVRKQASGLINGQLKNQIDSMTKFTQINLDSCKTGNVKVLFIALYPVERGWFQLRNIAGSLTDDELVTLGSICSSGFDAGVIHSIKDVIRKEDPINYFHELVEEYQFVNSAQARGEDNSKQFVVVDDYSELMNTINDPDDKIALVITIEGGHSLLTFDDYEDLKDTPFRMVNKPDRSEFKKYQAMFLEHIDAIKGKKSITLPFMGMEESVTFNHTPFYITLAHHFWNLICGHADSFNIGADFALDQGRAKNRKFSKLGKLVLRKLLYRDANERRILIDIKHLSIEARKEFFQIWEDEYEAVGDSFPIICSHSAVNGRDRYYDPPEDLSPEEQETEEESIFNKAGINLFDHDIEMIYRSKGLIGIILNNSRLPGNEIKRDIKLKKKKIKKKPILKPILEKEIQEDYMMCLTANIFHVVRLINKKDAWDILSIGSDFDGMIDALDGYEKAEDFPKLAEDLVEYIAKCEGIEEMGMSAKQMETLMFGYSAQEVVEKIMSKNALEFTRKYYHDKFLKEGISEE